MTMFDSLGCSMPASITPMVTEGFSESLEETKLKWKETFEAYY